MLKFNKNYFVLAIVIFFIELFIAIYVHDKIIRPYIGDLLVVILIYCFVKSFFDTGVFITCLSVLLFSYFVEMLQYFNIVDRLGLQNSRPARIIIGTSFAWNDMLAYTVGIVFVLFTESKMAKRRLLLENTRQPNKPA